MVARSVLPIMVAAGRAMSMDTKTAEDKEEAIVTADRKIMAGQAGDVSQKVAVLVTTNGREITEEAGSPMVANPNMVMISVPRAAATVEGEKGCLEEKEDVDQCL